MKKSLLIGAFSLMAIAAQAVNPILPMWEYIPDGEPYVFEDPDNPGKYRVYVYGSHDIIIDAYCGRDQVAWSAPVEDLSDWRYDGIILQVIHDRDGNLLNKGGVGDVLYAPDMALVVDADGNKTYYLYPNDQHGGRNGLVAKSLRPDGPFQVCNWSETNPTETDGVLRFDPGVFVDDDGRVYGYWGFEESFGGELDPANMANLLPGTEAKNMIPGRNQDDTFRFFEASSIRKIKDKYVLIYSRWTKDGDFGMPETNYTLAYAWSNNPLGPWTYGGTIIDGRGRETMPDGTTIHTATPSGNTHGSIAEVNGQWYVFYHRQCGINEFSRQAMIAPIDVEVVEGPQGYVKISEGEFTSEGAEKEGLKLDGRYSAGIACHFTGSKPSYHEYPDNVYFGPYIKATRFDGDARKAPAEFTNPMTHITNGSTIGYKYFNFDTAKSDKQVMTFDIVPNGIDATVTIIAGKPWEKNQKLGEFTISKDDPKEMRAYPVTLKGMKKLKGKQPLYLQVTSPVDGESIGDIYWFTFE